MNRCTHLSSGLYCERNNGTGMRPTAFFLRFQLIPVPQPFFHTFLDYPHGYPAPGVIVPQQIFAPPPAQVIPANCIFCSVTLYTTFQVKYFPLHSPTLSLSSLFSIQWYTNYLGSLFFCSLLPMHQLPNLATYETPTILPNGYSMFQPDLWHTSFNCLQKVLS